MDDHQLIAECLQGQEAAFGELVRRYQDRLYNAVYRIVHNAEDAQDVVQEAFFHAYQALDSFKGDAQFFTWLCRIAINAAISFRRRRKITVPIEFRPEGEMLISPVDESEGADPTHQMDRAEQGQRLHLALAQLSQEHRTVLVLKDMEGMKYEEMAEMLQVPIGTIRSRLHRARLELRAILEELEPD
ncbi:MAG: sigma-70 family RNA polymerase sigma factor [Gemmataceae bacterium]